MNEPASQPGAAPAEDPIAALARAARQASRVLARSPDAARVLALREIAAAIRADAAAIEAANARDVAAAADRGLDAAMIDRLRLTRERLDAMADAVLEVAALPDPIGRLEPVSWRAPGDGGAPAGGSPFSRRPSGIEVARMRIPLGVVCIIYESRPNVTTDAAALCIRSGNAVILRGGSEAHGSNRALGACVARGLAAAGLPAAAAQVVASTDRAAIAELLVRDDDIDLVIPRGGEGLIRMVAERSRIPVLKHYKGVCHLYVHRTADLDLALRLAEDGKASRPGVCNAVETILVDRDVAPAFVPRLCARLGALGVEIRGDDAVRALSGGAPVVAATDADWGAEYLALICAVRVVDGFDAAVAHIERWGSDHTEAIATGDPAVGERFLREVGSSTVLVNASTRFADGGQLGLGAEIGISTTRLHAYGPMGIDGLTTTKFVVRGSGQVRE